MIACAGERAGSGRRLGNVEAMKVRLKIWFEQEGTPVFGEGRYRLLKAVEREGSIAGAARSLGMSFRSAWTHLDRAERALRYRLLIRSRGGPGGGSTRLTPRAQHLLRAYEKISGGVERFVADRYGKEVLINGEEQSGEQLSD